MRFIIGVRLLPLVSLALALSGVMAATGGAAEPVVIRIGTLPGLRYDLSAFSVRPGAEVEVIFTNTDEMLHNLVIVRPGARLDVVNAAIATGTVENDFVPKRREVLWATRVVPSGESFSLKFTAPDRGGEYPYVCTFPGHGFVMFGTMIVTDNPGPPVPAPVTLPSVHGAMDHAAHAFAGARVVRTFMPAAGPASIAVSLPGAYSFCWDAGACRFRYAWKGGFIEQPERGTANLVGEVFYREPTASPLRVGAEPNRLPRAVEFHGYRLGANGEPEFEYAINGVTVWERVDVRDDRVIRHFRTNIGEGQVVRFVMPPGDEVRMTADRGARENGFLKFEGAAAREFTITIEPKGN